MIKVVTPRREFKLQLTPSHTDPCFHSEEVPVSTGAEIRSGGFQVEAFFFLARFKRC